VKEQQQIIVDLKKKISNTWKRTAIFALTPIGTAGPTTTPQRTLNTKKYKW
jgi:hypothetical protein